MRLLLDEVAERRHVLVERPPRGAPSKTNGVGTRVARMVSRPVRSRAMTSGARRRRRALDGRVARSVRTPGPAASKQASKSAPRRSTMRMVVRVPALYSTASATTAADQGAGLGGGSMWMTASTICG